MRIKATQFRQNLYNLLDQVLSTGLPLEIERNGQILKILPEKKRDKLDNLEPHQVISGDPEELVNIDWSSEWKEGEIV